MLSREEIEKILPHRAPFLFVDSVIELEPHKRILAARKFTEADDFFKGHFPDFPVVPGVVLAEAMAQTAGLLAYVSLGTDYTRHGASLLRMDRFYFRRMARMGDEVRLEAIYKHSRGPAWKFDVASTIDGEKCAEGELLAMFTDKTGRPARDFK